MSKPTWSASRACSRSSRDATVRGRKSKRISSWTLCLPRVGIDCEAYDGRSGSGAMHSVRLLRTLLTKVETGCSEMATSGIGLMRA